MGSPPLMVVRRGTQMRSRSTRTTSTRTAPRRNAPRKEKIMGWERLNDLPETIASQ